MNSMHLPVPDAVIEIRGLTRRFGPKVALDQVSLTVPAGTVVGLVGENGAGKTTLIKHVLGLLKAETGSVRVFGLDPVVRRDILGAIIRTIADEGRTVLFSSHLLGEVERVSDQVAMIQAGKILFCDPLERIKASHCRVTLRFDAPRSEPPRMAGAL